MEVLRLFEDSPSRPQWARIGAYGEQGSGKTVTLCKLVIGFYKHTGASGPVLFLDTEDGSPFVAPLFEKYDVPLKVKKTHSYNTFVTVLQQFPSVSKFLIVDSVTHFWKQFMEGYLNTLPAYVEKLRINDWGVLKPRWQKDVIQNIKSAQGHIFVSGRQSIVFGDEEDDTDLKPDGTPRTRSVKLGERMNAEGELGYDLDLLIHMTKRHRVSGGAYDHIARVVKDKNVLASLEGQEFKDPGFKEFKPYIDFLDLGMSGKPSSIDFADGEQIADNAKADASKAFFTKRDRDALLEEFENISKETCKGPNQANKNLVLEHLFGTTAFENAVKKSPANYGIASIRSAVIKIKRLRDAAKGYEKGLSAMTQIQIEEALDGTGTDGGSDKGEVAGKKRAAGVQDKRQDPAGSVPVAGSEG